MFPDGGNLTVVEGKIEEVSEEVDAIGTKVPEVEDGEAVGSGGTRVAAFPDGLGD